MVVRSRESASFLLRVRSSFGMPKPRCAFTLIELLVVIAIISLLVSILLPSLNRAKDLAKQSVCLSNLKSIGIAVQFYVDDHKEQFFESHWNNGNNIWTQGPQGGALLNYAGVGVPIDEPRFTEGIAFDCPGQPSRPPYPPDTEETNWWNFSCFRFLDYGYCAELGDWGGYKISEVRAQDIVVFYDSIRYRGYSFHYGLDYWNDVIRGWIQWHHPGETIDMVFVDGHASAETENVIEDDWFHPPG